MAGEKTFPRNLVLGLNRTSLTLESEIFEDLCEVVIFSRKKYEKEKKEEKKNICKLKLNLPPNQFEEGRL